MRTYDHDLFAAWQCQHHWPLPVTIRITQKNEAGFGAFCASIVCGYEYVKNTFAVSDVAVVGPHVLRFVSERNQVLPLEIRNIVDIKNPASALRFAPSLFEYLDLLTIRQLDALTLNGTSAT